MIDAKWTAPQIADVYGVNGETIRKFARRRGLTIVRNDADPTRHPSWKNGVTYDRQGYVMVRVEYDGPYGYLIRSGRKTDPRGYAPQHRMRMHDKLGRELLPAEVVHHIDGDVTNNDPANLELFATNAEHLRETLKGQVPNWTDDGRRRIAAGVQRAADQRRKPQPSAMSGHPKTDGQW